MIGYIDSSSFPVYTYGEIVAGGDPLYYYMCWSPSDIQGSFFVEGKVDYFSNYSGYYIFSKYNVIYSSTLQSAGFSYFKTNVEMVYQSAFYNCPNLTTVIMPNCKRVGIGAFYYCFSLNYVSIPVCTMIMEKAFYNNSNLTEIYMPSVALVSYSVFEQCSHLKRLDAPMLDLIYDGAFYRCYSLSEISIPNCTSIGSAAFMSCTMLSSIYLPLCKSIQTGGFGGCKNLETVNLPCCSFLGSGAFAGCTSLNTITLGWSSVCDIFYSLVFNKTGITSSTGSIFVPSSLVSSYKSATYWSYFSDRIYPINN